MNYIERPEYMQRLLDLMGTPDIKIITGVRRSGKSELMKAYIRRIREMQPEANIIFVDFFDLKYEGLKEYHALYDYIESHYASGKQNYLFVDEVQLCEKFELAINSLYSSRKYHLPDTTMLEHLAEFMMDNVSNLTSPNNISDTLTANVVATNHKTVGNYIRYLCDAYVFYGVRRYDIRGKKYLKTSVKYYLSDTGIRFARLGRRNLDYGRMYENIVCIELMRRGFEVYVGKLYQKEVDFVAVRGDEKMYIQVSDDISRPETFEREYDPLLKIKDAYPKLILANTRHETYDYEGIKIHNLSDWLLKIE